MTKQEIIKNFDAFNKLNVLIIGDVMVDSYLWGNVSRISPEAPVPIVAVSKRENRLGGAANVVLNIQSLGAKPIICSVIGIDSKGDDFIKLLKQQRISSDAIIRSKNRITTTKFRVIGNKMQMLRVDEETEKDITATETRQLLEIIGKKITGKGVDVIIFEDYDKGVITPTLIAAVVKLAGKHKIPIVVDPKKKNFLQYKGVTLFKPNLKELKEGLKLDHPPSDKKELEEISKKLHKELGVKYVLATLSDAGIFISIKKQQGNAGFQIPAHIRKISDVSGAGDTVVSTAALCVALNFSPEMIAQLANIAGGLVCEEVGVAPINKARLLREVIALLAKK
jgi:D-glycero-beta-D-manno-heptose-7-phosphate kinase